MNLQYIQSSYGSYFTEINWRKKEGGHTKGVIFEGFNFNEINAEEALILQLTLQIVFPRTAVACS